MSKDLSVTDLRKTRKAMGKSKWRLSKVRLFYEKSGTLCYYDEKTQSLRGKKSNLFVVI